MKVYAGIGSRKTPPHILELMRDTAFKLATNDWILRSGAAWGADSAFEEGALSSFHAVQPEIYLPKPGFERRPDRPPYIQEPTPEAFELTAKYHPAWHKVSPSARALHARNAHQVLGLDLKTPCRFVICWTPQGAETAKETRDDPGGTGQAIRIADAYSLAVFNLRRPKRELRFRRYLRDK